MNAKLALTLCLVAACTSEPPEPGDPCAMAPLLDGGSAEVGVGTEFASILEGQDVDVELGIQGLWMFVVNARVRDMDVGASDRRGVINVAAVNASGEVISLEVGCRVREFEAAVDGSAQLATAFLLAISPDVTGELDGAAITLRLEVRDHEGRQALDERTIVARMPMSSVTGATGAPTE